MKKFSFRKILLISVFLFVLFLSVSVGAEAAGTKTGWQKTDGVWYYLTADGSPRTGWLRTGGYWYYLDPDSGAMQTGWTEVDGSRYYLNASGRMRTGWLRLDGNWYYLFSSGRMAAGWVRTGGYWYYLDPGTGVMQTGWTEVDGDWYYLNSSGRMRTGWLRLNGNWYYLFSSGRMAAGWVRTGGYWYYLDPDSGVMQTGWTEVDGDWYYLNSSGRMATGWIRRDGDWYYLTASGRMAVGWQFADNDWYYFYTEDDENGGPFGAMADDTTIDGEIIKPGGAMLSDIEIYMKEHAQEYTSSTPYLILVDTDACKTGVFKRAGDGSWGLLYYWNCAPGKPSTPTIKGRFTVGQKGYYFDSYGSRCYYYTQFCGNYLFHSVLYTPDGELQDGRTGQQLSHGCVRLDLSNAKWIYNNIPTGTKVVVY